MLTRMQGALLSTLLAVVVYSLGCGDDPTKPDDNDDPGAVSEADSIAAVWMQALADSLENLDEDQESDYYRTIRYTEIRDGMNAALALNDASKVAHLGSALLDFIEINYSADVWNLVDSARTYEDETTALSMFKPLEGGLYLRPGSPLLKNQFTLLATAPREYLRLASGGIPSNLTVAELQRVLDEVVIAALTSALDHLDVAVSDGGPVVSLTVEDERHEIDVGEVFLFHAATHATRAAFRILTAYDLGLPGPNGRYDWVDERRNLHRCDDHTFFEPIGGGSPYNRRVDRIYRDRHPTSAARDSLAASIVKYNLESSTSGFLRRRTGGMAAAWQDLLAVRARLEDAVAAIRSETDPQENDVVKIVDLIDLDTDIATASDKPDFAQNFTTVEDVLGWIETVMSGPYQITEDGENGPINLTVNISAFFQGSPSDWRSLLPYHRFPPADQWQTDELQILYGPIPYTPGVLTCGRACGGTSICDSNVEEAFVEYRKMRVEPIEFLDGPGGNPVDLETVKVPYFPDYTLAGLFPGATRTTWLDIHTNAGW